MPQVHITLGPGVQNKLGMELINKIGSALMLDVEREFGIQGKKDVAFTVIEAIATEGEADIQVEVRYTVGKDEYDWGTPFNPSEEDQFNLITSIFGTLHDLFGDHFTTSVWCKPYPRSLFKM